MKTTLNLLIDPALMATVAAQLKNSELGRLFRALAAHMAGEDAGQYLTNSGLRLAYALLSPSIDESLKRKAVASVRGARGGRPRKEPDCRVASSGTAENGVSTKKSKKEDLPPTPPIEEKNKKNNSLKNYQKHENTNNKNRWQFIAGPVARREHERQSRLQEVCGVITQLATQGEQPAQVPF